MENVFITGPFQSGYKTIFKIIEKKKKNRPIQFISPPLIINSFNSDYSSFLLSYDNLNLDSNNEFILFINKLENKIQIQSKSIFKKINKKMKEHQFLSCIKHWNNSNFIQLYKYNENVEVYDYQRNIIKCSDIKKQSLAKFYIWINNLTIKNNKWYITLNIMQIKLLDPLPPIGCIIDVPSIIKYPINNLDNSNSDKYEKMLKMGVPLEAVENKRKMDGVYNICRPKINLHGLQNVKLKKASLNKKKPLLPTKTNSLIPSLSDIKNQLLKLNKTNFKKNKVSQNYNTNTLIPSLEDIQIRLSKLNKVDKHYLD